MVETTHASQPPVTETPLETHSSPPIVERDGKRFVVIAFTDLDGTVNDETKEEKDRISSIGPAIVAVKALEAKHIPVGGLSARSAGEVSLYLKKLHGDDSAGEGETGISIGEDGATALLGKSFNEQARAKLATRFTVVPHGENFAVVLSNVKPDDLRAFMGDMQHQIADSGSSEQIISTVTSTPEQIQQAAGHETVELAAISADRLATAYVANPTPLQEKLISEQASSYGLRTFQRETPPGEKADVILVFPQDANKGHALELINAHADLFFPDLNVQGILPIVFGNHTNDLPLFEKAHAMGGFGVLVAHPHQENGAYTYAVPHEAIPNYVIKATQPHGFGMQEAVPQVFTKIDQKYNTKL